MSIRGNNDSSALTSLGIWSLVRSGIEDQSLHHLYHYHYPLDMNRYLILPLWSQFKSVVLAFDVIHCLGFHSSGTKPDAIPGRIHLASTIRVLTKGQHIGFCYESCGQGHTSMLIVSKICFTSYMHDSISQPIILLQEIVQDPILGYIPIILTAVLLLCYVFYCKCFIIVPSDTY